jgi:hypothetical protein
MKHLTVSDDLRYRLAMVRLAEERDPEAIVLRKVELANVLLDLFDEANRRRRVGKLAGVKPRPASITTDVTLRLKRRRA